MFTKRMYDAERKGTKPESLIAIVGMVNRRGQSAMMSFSHLTDFQPVMEAEVIAAGRPTACKNFLDGLAAVEDSLLPNPGSWELDLHVWAMQLATHLYHGVIEPGEDPKVGGYVQFAVLSEQGWREDKISTTSTPDIPETWQQVTVERDALRRYHEVWKVPRLASGELDFGLHRLVEPSP